MRYRRLSYRYAMIVSPGQGRPFDSTWQLGNPRVVMAHPVWSPPTDVSESATAVTVTAELAGIDPEDLELVAFEDALILEGQRRLPRLDDGGVYHVAEIRQGRFRLELPLPALIDVEKVNAEYERGLLRVTLPKAARGNTRGD